MTNADAQKRMVCIWSTSVRLTWGVASLRAIIKNMHTWSSRLLKPRLQVAISQASRSIPVNNLFDFHRPWNRYPLIPTVNCLGAEPTNSPHTAPSTSPKVAPIIAQLFGKPMTPERHNTPAPRTRIDTPTPSRSPENTCPRSNTQAKELPNSRNGLMFGTNNNAFGDHSTTRTPGLFGRATGSGTGVFRRSGLKSSTSTTTGFGLRIQRAIESGGIFGGTSTDVARGSGQDTSGPDTSSGHTRGSLFGSSNPAANSTGVHENSNKRSTSSSPSKLVTTSSGSNDSINNSSACGSSLKQAFGPSWKPTFNNHDNNDQSSTLGPSPEPVSVSLPKPAIGSPYKPYSGGFGTSSNSDGGESFGFASPSYLIALSDIDESTSSPSVDETDVCDITTAFESTSLEDVFRDYTNPGTAGTSFSAYRQSGDFRGQDDFQTITCQSPYKNYSLEELRVADYDRGRRYRLPSNELDQCTDSSKTQGHHTDDDSDNNSDGDSDNNSDGDSKNNPNDDVDNDPNNDSDGEFNDADVESNNDSNDDSNNDSNDDCSSDISSGRSTHGALMIHGLRLIDLPSVKRMISDLEAWQQQRILRDLALSVNPEGIYSVPLRVLVREINMFLEPVDQIT
jgi:hypothetical protein